MSNADTRIPTPIKYYVIYYLLSTYILNSSRVENRQKSNAKKKSSDLQIVFEW